MAYEGLSFLTAVRAIKWMGMAGLALTALYGTVVYDGRFTMLLVPSFLVMWASDQEATFMEALRMIPAVHWIFKMFDALGPTGSKVSTTLYALWWRGDGMPSRWFIPRDRALVSWQIFLVLSGIWCARTIFSIAGVVY